MKSTKIVINLAVPNGHNDCGKEKAGGKRGGETTQVALGALADAKFLLEKKIDIPKFSFFKMFFSSCSLLLLVQCFTRLSVGMMLRVDDRHKEPMIDTKII